MADGKTLLKGAGIVILGFIILSVLWTLVSIVLGTVAWAVTMAIRLMVLAAVLYGVYWAYKTFVAGSKSTSREREKIFE